MGLKPKVKVRITDISGTTRVCYIDSNINYIQDHIKHSLSLQPGDKIVVVEDRGVLSDKRSE